MQYDDYACRKEPSFPSYLREQAIETFMFNGRLTLCIQFLDKGRNRLRKVNFIFGIFIIYGIGLSGSSVPQLNALVSSQMLLALI